uniref:Uncharacterized protein n=1 Tax=Triticum urartu TaxID=4572 RepID=A0A8R7V4L6_TRIUA
MATWSSPIRRLSSLGWSSGVRRSSSSCPLAVPARKSAASLGHRTHLAPNFPPPAFLA